jgi:hypothetical protein
MSTIKELRITAKQMGFKVTGRKTSKDGKVYQEFLPRALIEKMIANKKQAVPPPEWSAPTAATGPTTPPKKRVKIATKRAPSKAAAATRKKLAKLMPGYETWNAGHTAKNAQRDLDAYFTVDLNSGKSVNARKVAKVLKGVEKFARSMNVQDGVGRFVTEMPDRSPYTTILYGKKKRVTNLTPLNVEAIHSLTGRYAIPGKRQNLYWDSRAYGTKRELRRAGITPLADGLGSSLHPDKLHSILNYSPNDPTGMKTEFKRKKAERKARRLAREAVHVRQPTKASKPKARRYVINSNSNGD